MEHLGDKRRFSVATRAKSFTHAGRGIWIVLKTTHNAWIQLALLALAVLLGVVVKIDRTDWLLIILAAGLVLTAEAFNTAIETAIDLASPEDHPFARDTKDVAAGAVLISAVTAFLIGVFIFVPRVFG